MLSRQVAIPAGKGPNAKHCSRAIDPRDEPRLRLSHQMDRPPPPAQGASGRCNEWEEFDGTCAAQKIMGGQGNMDDNVLNLPSGSCRRHAGLRSGASALVHLVAGRPHAVAARSAGSREVRGRHGTFLADGTFAGRRFACDSVGWTRSRNPGWEQAFSEDVERTGRRTGPWYSRV
jgi:hypothetical protein